MAPEAGEMMTVEEIYRRYPDEWVLVADPEATPMHEVTAGRVIWHGRSRDEMYRFMKTTRENDLATIFTGQPPADVEFAL